MARSAGITITGDKKLTRKLEQFEAKVAKKIVRKAMREAMRPMHAAVKGNMPVGETGGMKRSVKLRALKRSRRGFGIEVHVESPGVGAVEFGTVDQPPQAPTRRAFDEEAARARRRVIDLIWQGIRAEAEAKGT